MSPTLKIPSSVTFVRHGESAYNALAKQKFSEPDFQKLVIAYDKSMTSRRTRDLAKRVMEKLKAPWGDHDTPLTEHGKGQSIETGSELALNIPRPDVILCSPYLRTRDTLTHLVHGWALTGDTEIFEVEVVYENLLREQNYGVGILYNDWRVFQALNPEQKRLRDIKTPYWYQYPQGESIADVVDRMRAFHDSILSKYARKNVLIVSHHRTILAYAAQQKKMQSDEVLKLDDTEKPINCGVTMFQRKNFDLALTCYNKRLWEKSE